MKFVVKDKIEGEKKLEFSLEKLPSGGIELVATDYRGDAWAVLKIKAEGKLYLYDGLRDDLGLHVDTAGEIYLSSLKD